jgi:hypothetical protein
MLGTIYLHKQVCVAVHCSLHCLHFLKPKVAKTTSCGEEKLESLTVIFILLACLGTLIKATNRAEYVCPMRQ